MSQIWHQITIWWNHVSGVSIGLLIYDYIVSSVLRLPWWLGCTDPYLHLLKHRVVLNAGEEYSHSVRPVVQEWNTGSVQLLGQFVNVGLELSECFDKQTSKQIVNKQIGKADLLFVHDWRQVILRLKIRKENVWFAKSRIKYKAIDWETRSPGASHKTGRLLGKQKQ